MRMALLSPAVGTGNIGDQLIEDAVRRLVGGDVTYERFSTRRPLKSEEIERINESSCALLCGTNLYQRRWECRLTPETVRRLRVPLIPIGMGGSAARMTDLDVSQETRLMIRALHAHCEMGSVRDPYSAAVVARTGVKNVALTGCPVLFWSGSPTLPVPRPTPRRRIVVTARNWLMHREPHNVNHPVQIRLLRQVFETFRGEDVVFAIHEDFDTELVGALGLSAERVFRPATSEDCVSLYTRGDTVVLASRLHAGMLAIANGVPTLFVGHDTRTYSFCDMLGLPYVELFSDTCGDECIEGLRRLLAGDVSLPRTATGRYAELRRAMADCLRRNGVPFRGAVE
jgi:hypothetical protein